MKLTVYLLLFLSLTNNLFATDKNWTGATSTNWNTASNWNPSGVPTGSDYVYIDKSANNPVIPAGTTATVISIQLADATLTINAGGRLNIRGDGGLFNYVDITSNSTLTNNGILAMETAAGGAVIGKFNAYTTTRIDNYGIIRVSSSNGFGVGLGQPNYDGDLSPTILNNYVCGQFIVNGSAKFAEATLTNNTGLIQIGYLINASSFTNNGVLKYSSLSSYTPANNQVIVNENPGNSTIFSYGGSFNMTVDGIYKNAAATTSAGTFIAPNTFTPSGLPVGSQTLYAKITPQGGACSYVVPFTYEMASPPSFTTNPTPKTVCSGISTTFTVAAFGADSYQWQVNTGNGSFANVSNTTPYSGVSDNTLTISNVAGLNGYQYRCVATGDGGSVTSTAATLTVSTITVTNPTTTTGTQGTGFSQSFSANGGTAPRSYSLNSGTLPTGLSLNPTTGILAGTPTQSGSFSITVRATDANGCSGVSNAYTLSIVNSTPTITGFAAVDNLVCLGLPLTFTATVGNVTGSYNYTLTNGSSTTAGATSSTNFSQSLRPTTASNQSFTLIVSDNSQSTRATTDVTVSPALVATLTANFGGTLTCAQTSLTLTSSGGTSYNFARQGGGGIIETSGNPILPNPGETIPEFEGYAVVNASGVYSVTVSNYNTGCVSTTTTTIYSNTATLTVTNPSTTTGVLNVNFNQTFTVSGGVAPRSFSIATGSFLPTGLSLNATTGVLSGTPTQSGSFSITVRATDANGCTGVGASYNLVIGSTATVTTAAPSAVLGSSATLGGNVTNDGGASVTERGVVYLTGNGTPTTSNTKVGMGSGTGPFSQSVAGLASGTLYSVRAYAINAAGTSYGSVQTFTTAIAPSAPVVNTPANGSRLNNNRPPYTGTSVPSSTVTVFVDGSSIGESTADANGNWSFTPTVPLSDNSHMVFARARLDDVDSPNSNTNTFIIDTTAPAAPTVTAPTNGQTISDNTPTYTGTAEPGSTVTVFVGGTTIGTTPADGAGNWSFTATVPLADGSHAVKATATDVVGNTSPYSNTNTFTVDTTLPTVSVASSVVSPTSTSPIPVTITFSKSVTGLAGGEISVSNGTLNGFAGSGFIYTVNVTPTTSGLVSVSVGANVAQDIAGNGNTASNRLSIQYAPMPTLAGFVATSGAVCAGSPVTFTATVGNVSGNYSYTLTNGSNPLTGSTSGNFSQNLTASGSGVQNFTLTVSTGGPSATATTSLTVGQSGATRLYVKQNASGANTGLSWQDAFTDLQSALKYPCIGSLTEIWIARGVYKPRSGQISDAFSMLPDVAIYGGFEGSETDLSQRPPITASNPSSTTLSADIDSDGTVLNNSHYIIYNRLRLTSTAILDGAVITDPLSGTQTAAIMNSSSGNPSSGLGSECSPQFRNLLFTGYITGQPFVSSSGMFVKNDAFVGGTTSPSFVNCVFRNNQGDGYNSGCINTQISSNGSSANLMFVNCVFANSTGTQIRNFSQVGNAQIQTRLINCSFLNLSDGILYNRPQSNSPISVDLSNSILWNAGGSNTFREEAGSSTATVTAQYSLLDQAITGYASGPGNLTATSSPVVSAGDLNIPNTSPAVNAGNPASVTVASGSYSATNLPTIDAAANPRIVGSRVDMGALEVQNPVAPAPTIANFLANPDPLCVGSSTTFSASIGNISGSYAYTLTNGTSTTTGNSSNVAFSQAITATQAGIQTFTLNVSSNGQSATATYELTVNAPPTISVQASHGGQLTCAVNSLTLTAGGGDEYRFSGPGIVSQDPENGLAVINAAGVYSVTAAYGETGCFSTTTTTITSATSVVTISNPATTTATVNTAFSQSFSTSGGSGAYSYSVVSSDLPSSLSLSASGLLSGTPTQAGSYTLLVSAQDANGCVGLSTRYALQVIDQTPTVMNFAASSSTVCVGSPVAFTANVANITGSYAYTLTNGTSTTTGSSGNALFSHGLTATGSGVQTFTLTVMSSGQTASATTALTISSLPTASLVSSGTLTCAITSVTLTASGGSSYTFTNGSEVVGTPGSASTLVVSTPGTYSVAVANANGCINTTSTSVQSTTGTVAVSNPTTTTATLTSGFNQSFVASGGTGSYSFSLASGSLPNGLSLNPTSGVVSGTPTQSGSFSITVRATDANGCSGTSATYSLVITDPTPTLVGLSANPSAVCVGSPVTFTTTVGNVSGSYAYTLSNGQGTPITGNASATTFSQNLTASGTGSQSYTLTVSANGQRVTATANLTVNSLPVAGLVSSGTLTCAVTSVTLTASGGSSYTFTNGDSVLGTPGSANMLVVTTPGTYSVAVANASGCISTTSITVDQELTLPTASLTNNGPLSCNLTSVTLTAGGGTTYRFSTGTSPLAAPHQVSVSVAGVYSVTVVNANGCSAVASTTVTGGTQAPTTPTLQTSATTTIGQPISVTATGCSGSLNWNLVGGTGSANGNLYTVSNPGNYTLSASCSLASCTSPVASLTLSIQANNDLRLLAPDYDCQTGAFTFHSAGGDSSPVEYFAIGITSWTTNPEQYTDRGLRGDPKKVTLQARQNGVVVSYVFDMPAYCAGLPTPPQSSNNPAPILVNPIAGQVTTQYQPYSFTIPAGTFTDPQGEPLTYYVLGLTPGLRLSGMTIQGTPTTAGRPIITVIAVDPSGQTANTSFSLSINPPNPPAPSADPFELSVAAYDCSLGWITLQTSGGNGTAVEYRIEGVIDWTSNANLVIPLAMRQSSSIGLKARQGGVEVSLVFDAAAACGPTPPDLTAVLYARPSTMSSQTACSVVVEVVEVAGVASTGPITVMISKDPRVQLSFDAGLSNVGGQSVQNSVWTLDTSKPSYYVLTTSQVIPRSQSLRVGLTGVLRAGSTTGVLTVSATVVAGSGGETQFDNNTDADKIEYFQQ